MSTYTPEDSDAHGNFAAKAALLVVGFVWGGNFAATKFALEAFSPWTFRTVSYTAGAVLLMLVAVLAGASLRVDRASDRLHLAISGLFGCAGFGALSAIAVLHTSTGRAAICTYTMPIWAVLLSRVVLKEPLTVSRVASLTLCCAGLSILLWPLVRADVSLGVLAALGAAVSWAIAVVYLKWARVTAHPFAMAVWQLLAGAIASAIGALFESHAAWTPMGTLPM
ncbi:DMT family transporter [Hyphomicrobium sp.]|uniref:DMT family transporter n=1 Tax=Hyphomicrobium sp. TaxID=82 RepID=UPI002FE09718